MVNFLRFVGILTSLVFSFSAFANTCPDGPVTKLRGKISGAGIDDAQAYTQGAFYEMGVCACLSGKLSPKANVAGLKSRSMIARNNAREYKPGISLRPWPATCKTATAQQSGAGREQDLSVDYGRVMKYAARLQRVTEGFARRVDAMGDLAKAANPTALMQEFNSKMANLNQIDESISNAQINRTAKGIEQMADAATNLNETSFYQSIGSLASLYDLSEARAKAKEQQARLKAQQRSQMSQFYWRAVDETNAQMADFANRAAFAEDKNTEDYWMAMVEHLQCYQQSMRSNWQPNSTAWLQNNCPVPQAPNLGIPNNLISAEQKALKLAERKYRRYLESTSVGLDVDASNKHGFWQVVVVNVEPLSPANLAGIKRNDTIMGVYGHPSDGTPLDLTEQELKQFVTADLERNRQTVSNMENSIRAQEKNFSSKSMRKLKKRDPQEYAQLERMHKSAIEGARLTMEMAQMEIARLETGGTNPQYGIGIYNQRSAELVEQYIESGRVRWLTVGTETINLEPRGPRAFRDAAIAFASKAQTLNPSPETDLLLAKYHEDDNEFIALGYLYAALDAGANLSDEDLARLQRLESNASTVFQTAAQSGNTEALNSLVQSGLHERFLIGGNDLLTLAIKMNQPNAVQVVLNAYVNEVTDAERKRIVEEAMLKMASYDSAKSLAHLFNQGLEKSFTRDGKTLRSEAQAHSSQTVLTLLDTGKMPETQPYQATPGVENATETTADTFVMPPGGEQEFLEKCKTEMQQQMSAAISATGISVETMCQMALQEALKQR